MCEHLNKKKNGRSRDGKQRMLCLDCQASWTVGATRNTITKEEVEKARRYIAEGDNMAQAAFRIGASPQALRYRLLKKD